MIFTSLANNTGVVEVNHRFDYDTMMTSTQEIQGSLQWYFVQQKWSHTVPLFVSLEKLHYMALYDSVQAFFHVIYCARVIVLASGSKGKAINSKGKTNLFWSDAQCTEKLGTKIKAYRMLLLDVSVLYLDRYPFV